MTTFTVANASQLNSAVASARGGDTIVMKDGNYGNVRIEADYASTVTIRAENHQDATIGTLQVWGGSNIRFEGLTFSSGMNGSAGRGVVSIENSSSNITIANSEVKGSVDGAYGGHNGVYVRNSSGVSILNNNIHDADNGVVIYGGPGANVSGNTIDYVGGDVMKFSGLSNATISGNKSAGHMYPVGSVHPDFIQFEGNSSNVRISGNSYLPATIGWAQGIFMSDGTYNNVTIDNNLVYTGMLRGISVSAGSGITIRDNTVLNAPGVVHNATKIFAPSGASIENNIWSGSGGNFGSNVELQSTNPNGAFYVNAYYKNATKGIGVTLQDLVPVAGSAADTKGADALLDSLLGGGTVTPAPTPSAPTPSAPTPSAPAVTSGEISINSGAGATGGFVADRYHSGGSTYGTSAAIANTSQDAIYQTERYGNFSYSVPVANGTYDVTLKFAELYVGGAGDRVFDVRAEGRTVLDNYDVFREAGGKNVAVDETIRVSVTDGRLDLGFAGVVENAKVNGIEIEPASGSAPAAPAPSGTPGIKVNAGGPATGGYSADTFYIGGSTYGTSAAIANTSQDAIYQTERYGNFKYSAAVANGTYEVTLKFAELYVDGAGDRLFDVRAEGRTMLDNYDIFRKAGGKNAAVDETFKVAVTDGRLDLDFLSVVENAKVSGIEIDLL